jgi:hypothetical protein
MLIVTLECTHINALCNNIRMNLHRIVRQIRSFMQANGYSESSLSRAVGIPQPTIHRALKNPLRFTKTHKALCKFADIDSSTGSGHQEAREELIQELLDIWDGSREHAGSLARLLRAAATLQTYGVNRTSRAR